MPILHIFCEVLTKWRILRQKCADTVAVFNSGHVWGHMPYVGQRSNDLWHNACTSYDLWIRNEDKYDNTGSVTGEDITWEVWFHDNLKVNFRHFGQALGFVKWQIWVWITCMLENQTDKFRVTACTS